MVGSSSDGMLSPGVDPFLKTPEEVSGPKAIFKISLFRVAMKILGRKPAQHFPSTWDSIS